MDNISTTVWQRRGSCIIFDQKSYGPFIANGAMISLRQVLTWHISPPAMPVPQHTILVVGLETVVETMPCQDAEDFLRCRVRPFLIDFQNRWPQYGVVFGFTAHPKAFEETTREEEVLFRRRDRTQVRLSESLWDGTATVHMRRVLREDSEAKEDVHIGYYVARIS